MAIIVAISAMGLVVVRPGSAEVGLVDATALDPPGPGIAVVGRLRESGGLSLFGMRVVDATHYAEVLFTTGADCAGLLHSGDPWPTPHPACSAPVHLAGEIGSIGKTSSGRSMIGVEFAVPGDCHDRLEPGVEWPAGHPECGPG